MSTSTTRIGALCALLVSLLPAGAAASERSLDENDRAWNGFLKDGSHVLISHYWAGDGISSYVFAAANAQLALTFPKLTGGYEDECLLIPQIYGYDVLLLTKKRLSERQKKSAHQLIEGAFAVARAKAKKFGRKP